MPKNNMLLRIYTKRQILVIFLGIFVFVLLVPLTTHAQLGFSDNSRTSLETDPRYPKPNSEYTVKIRTFAFDMDRSSIRWFIDGSEDLSLENEKEITLSALSLGIATKISALITTPGGSAVNPELVMMPEEVDLIIEGRTTAPAFYSGRRLPSEGSGVRVVAVPHMYSDSGERLNTNDLIFRWSINDRVVEEGRGKDALSTTLSRSTRDHVTVVIEDLANTKQFRRTIDITLGEPTVLFYENNPLFGLSERAVINSLDLETDEVVVRAEPYYVSEDIYDNAQLSWTLNGNAVENPGSDPLDITLRRVGGGGSAEVGFSIRNLEVLLQRAVGLFRVDFKDNSNIVDFTP